jgi:hypothetical protein
MEGFLNDFMFELNSLEVKNLVSEFVIPTKRKLEGSMPIALTE